MRQEQTASARAINRSWVAIRVGGTVSAFQPDLVRAIAIKLYEEIRINAKAARRVGVQLDHPTLQALGIELLVPGVVERVCKVNPPPVATHLDHLRCAVQWLIRSLR